MIEMKEWDGFEGRLWKEEINVRQFIQDNYTPYAVSYTHLVCGQIKYTAVIKTYNRA